ncbi:unnamed protein product [Brachionus calyciflorus]|uniref:ATP-dependent DNA helicase n=1 Tax=Brachionus calyciflorus TaxID=104777 RepID=A0A814LLJ4_9BILA|nr:unnamed protein product [Brachionus calyciflorus]
MILIRSAGTGKSFTVFAICTYLDQCLKRCAPTAKASFIIRGETIHSLLQISVDNENNNLKSDKLKKLQEEFENVIFLIIDEFSMVSQKLFGFINKRLQEIKANNLHMGGISVILVGDPGQLLPVCGRPLYSNKANCPASIDGWNSYSKFEVVVMLETSER